MTWISVGDHASDIYGYFRQAEAVGWEVVARLGGFLGRQSDGNPGWQTIWRGWQKLQDLAWQPSP